MARRKHIGLMAQLHAALYQLGLEPHEVELDHAPALALREWDEEAQDTRPPASDPKYLVWRTKADHKVKTFGLPATTAGSDIGNAAKLKRIEKTQAFYREFMAAKQPGQKRPRKSRIKSAGFRVKGKRMSGAVERWPT